MGGRKDEWKTCEESHAKEGRMGDGRKTHEESHAKEGRTDGRQEERGVPSDSHDAVYDALPLTGGWLL